MGIKMTAVSKWDLYQSSVISYQSSAFSYQLSVFRQHGGVNNSYKLRCMPVSFSCANLK